MNKKGFTLIEMTIVITIIGILLMIVMAPYSMYSNIAKVKVSKEIIEQTLSEARNSAAGLVNSIDKSNQNIGLIISKGKDNIRIVGFPYNYVGPIKESSSTKLIREVKLETNVNINKILDSTNGELDSIVVYYRAPNGNMDIFLTETSTGNLNKIIIGLKEATTGAMSREVIIK